MPLNAGQVARCFDLSRHHPLIRSCISQICDTVNATLPTVTINDKPVELTDEEREMMELHWQRAGNLALQWIYTVGVVPLQVVHIEGIDIPCILEPERGSVFRDSSGPIPVFRWHPSNPLEAHPRGLTPSVATGTGGGGMDNMHSLALVGADPRVVVLSGFGTNNPLINGHLVSIVSQIDEWIRFETWSREMQKKRDQIAADPMIVEEYNTGYSNATIPGFVNSGGRGGGGPGGGGGNIAAVDVDMGDSAFHDQMIADRDMAIRMETAENERRKRTDVVRPRTVMMPPGKTSKSFPPPKDSAEFVNRQRWLHAYVCGAFGIPESLLSGGSVQKVTDPTMVGDQFKNTLINAGKYLETVYTAIWKIVKQNEGPRGEFVEKTDIVKQQKLLSVQVAQDQDQERNALRKRQEEREKAKKGEDEDQEGEDHASPRASPKTNTNTNTKRAREEEEEDEQEEQEENTENNKNKKEQRVRVRLPPPLLINPESLTLYHDQHVITDEEYIIAMRSLIPGLAPANPEMVKKLLSEKESATAREEQSEIRKKQATSAAGGGASGASGAAGAKKKKKKKKPAPASST